MQGPSLAILCGVSYSGKSYLSRLLKMSRPNIVVLSTDVLLLQFAKTNQCTYSQAYERHYTEAKNQVLANLQSAVIKNKDIVVDRTNITVNSRKLWLDNTPSHYSKMAIICEASHDDMNQRKKYRRSHKISDIVISDQISKWCKPTVEEGFDEILYASDIMSVLEKVKDGK